MPDANQALEQALRLQQAGDYPAAETVLREFLETHPENQDGLHLLGLCCHAQMRHREALKWLEEAIAPEGYALNPEKKREPCDSSWKRKQKTH